MAGPRQPNFTKKVKVAFRCSITAGGLTTRMTESTFIRTCLAKSKGKKKASRQDWGMDGVMETPCAGCAEREKIKAGLEFRVPPGLVLTERKWRNESRRCVYFTDTGNCPCILCPCNLYEAEECLKR